MHLKSLEIQGFKSFPDKTKLYFGEGLTAIVGPNGSGKSNISDAMRWVLGEQSTKTLRGQRMEDIIFGGTQNRKPQGFAQVSITLDNTRRKLDIDQDEVTVTRKLYRSGESEYKINSLNVRLKDIYELFMDTGLGRDGYSIIGQGKISEIITAKPIQRREIFEEAAGISKFRYRKEEAQKRLLLAEENLLRLKDILTELEDRIGPLKTQSEKAKRYLSLSEQKKTAQVSLWIHTLHESRQVIKSYEDKILICRNQHEEIEQKLQEIEDAVQTVYKSIQKISVEMEECRASLRRDEETLAVKDSDVAVLRNDIEHNDADIARISSEIDETQDANTGIDERIDEKKRQAEEQRTALAERKAQHEKLREEDAKLDALLLQYDHSIREQSGQLEQLGETLSNAKVQAITSQASIEQYQDRIETLKTSITQRRDNIAQIQKEFEDCRGLDEQIRKRLHEKQREKEAVQQDRQKAKEEQEQLQLRAGQLLLQAKGFQQKAQLLKDMEKNLEGYAHSVKYIIKQSRNGRVPGIIGTVSQLMEVEERYTLAIETAVGGAMQNIVVEDENAAKAGIRTLKENRAGRATFLPLSSVRGQRLEQNLSSQEGFIGIASDLVRHDKRYEGVYRSILGRVAIVDNIENAAAIAKRFQYRFKITTLDGQVVNLGGSFTGGSAARSGGMLSRKNEIEKLGKQYEDALAEKQGTDRQLETLQTRMDALTVSHNHLREQVNLLNADRIQYESEQKRIGSQLQENKDAYLAQERELARLQKELEQLREKRSFSKEQEEALGGRIRSFDEKVASLKEERRALRERKQQMGESLSKVSIEMLSAEKDLQMLEQSLRTLEESGRDRRRKMELLGEQVRQKKALNLQIEEQLREIARQKKRIEAQIQERRARIQTLSAEHQQTEGKINGFRMEEKDVLSQREGVSKELARLEEKQLSLQGDYDKIIAAMWDEYELTRSEAAEIAKPVENRIELQKELNQLRSAIKSLGSVNVDAIEEYKEVSERYEFLQKQVNDCVLSRDELTSLISELTVKMREIFLESFKKIDDNFRRIFTELFGGGKASLQLTEGEDVLQSGVEIFVQPPGKIIKNLSALSGGEQSFVAIAIYFSILKVHPSPFCILDEIEAALDDVNVNKYAEFLHTMNRDTQFITITHRRGTMEAADMLYGVTMQEDGVSKILQLNVSEVESKLGIKKE
ncbi:chromosome segregation protein SMC [Candidatus Soleaferrea massiliensis]|uniref:chromosome segregation protein SMC n=1 Tax=Candidatus Soleaferrea massiliensis TaxID=1470354 RepID=UPI00058DC6E3|nr:chromosome segregation protein SMC [Candidatus Soleaferrea massiliensis]